MVVVILRLYNIRYSFIKTIIIIIIIISSTSIPAQDIVRETDAVKRQQSELRDKSNSPNNDINFIRSGKFKSRGRERREQNNKSTAKSCSKDFPNKQSCFRCGKNPSHSRERCPARNSTCNKCSKIGHWAKMRRTKVFAEIFDDSCDENANYEFLGEVTSKDKAQWKIDLKLNREKVQFKIDTGADETCIPFSTYESMKRKLPVLLK